METDPIGYGDGLNMYGYVGGDPVNARDPSGLRCQLTSSAVNSDGEYVNTFSGCNGGGGGGGFGAFGFGSIFGNDNGSNHFGNQDPCTSFSLAAPSLSDAKCGLQGTISGVVAQPEMIEMNNARLVMVSDEDDRNISPEARERCAEQARCLVPANPDTVLSTAWKDGLWDKFYTGAPRRQRRSVEQYKIVKRA